MPPHPPAQRKTIASPKAARQATTFRPQRSSYILLLHIKRIIRVGFSRTGQAGIQKGDIEGRLRFPAQADKGDSAVGGLPFTSDLKELMVLFARLTYGQRDESSRLPSEMLSGLTKAEAYMLNSANHAI